MTSVAVALMIVLAGGLPASAAIATREDPVGDAPAYLDISGVRYRNADTRVSARMFMPALERRGSARFIIGRPYSDVMYVASVRVRSDGSLARSFVYQTSISQTPKSCAFGVAWRVADQFIRISVPQACVSSLGGGALYVAAVTGASADYAPSIYSLRRG